MNKPHWRYKYAWSPIPKFDRWVEVAYPPLRKEIFDALIKRALAKAVPRRDVRIIPITRYYFRYCWERNSWSWSGSDHIKRHT